MSNFRLIIISKSNYRARRGSKLCFLSQMLPLLRIVAQIPRFSLQAHPRHDFRIGCDSLHHLKHGLFGRRTSRNERGTQTHPRNWQQSLYDIFHHGSGAQVVGLVQGVLCQWLEHLRSHHCDCIPRRSFRREHQRNLGPEGHETGKN